MYELPWFKTETNIFSNRKIQLILKLTDGIPILEYGYS